MEVSHSHDHVHDLCVGLLCVLRDWFSHMITCTASATLPSAISRSSSQRFLINKFGWYEPTKPKSHTGRTADTTGDAASYEAQRKCLSSTTKSVVLWRYYSHILGPNGFGAQTLLFSSWLQFHNLNDHIDFWFLLKMRWKLAMAGAHARHSHPV